ncbi:MAG: hypothetical protein H6755_07950 [Candidatus Omnitrophica bacterium]|nr:hypothetical protein [Candidatus Omnitrophota bacterium]MCB9748325.1 hypothetical protein [Candidatus Omnitrophota bacterium]
MKKYFVYLLVLSSLFIFSSPSFAYTGPMQKLGKGLGQVLSAPFSIFTETAKQINENESRKGLAVVGGILEGTAQMAYKPLVGLLNILTFPIAD